MKIEILPKALAELEAHAVRYEKARSGLGDEFTRTVREAWNAVARMPLACPIYGRGTRRRERRCLLLRFPFAIIYRIERDTILVVAIAHHRRRPGYWQGR